MNSKATHLLGITLHRAASPQSKRKYRCTVSRYQFAPAVDDTALFLVESESRLRGGYYLRRINLAPHRLPYLTPQMKTPSKSALLQQKLIECLCCPLALRLLGRSHRRIHRRVFPEEKSVDCAGTALYQHRARVTRHPIHSARVCYEETRETVPRNSLALSCAHFARAFVSIRECAPWNTWRCILHSRRRRPLDPLRPTCFGHRTSHALDVSELEEKQL